LIVLFVFHIFSPLNGTINFYSRTPSKGRCNST
jgi:hypothetical protein